MNQSCVHLICPHPSVCVEQYYTDSFFLYEERLWSWIYLYIPLTTMMFTHDAWRSFGSTSIFLMIQEIITAFLVVLGYPFIPSGMWDPGNVALGFFYALGGISLAMLFIIILKSPRLIRFPYEEIGILSREYNIVFAFPEFKNIFKFLQNDYNYVRRKYYLELISIQISCYASAFIIPTTKLHDMQHPVWFRLDWIVLVISQYFIILLCYMINQNHALELEVMWGYDKGSYVRFYGIWATLFGALTLPGMFMLIPTKASTLLSLLLSYILLTCIYCYNRINKV